VEIAFGRLGDCQSLSGLQRRRRVPYSWMDRASIRVTGGCVLMYPSPGQIWYMEQQRYMQAAAAAQAAEQHQAVCFLLILANGESSSLLPGFRSARSVRVPLAEDKDS
jgi:hypothetical protein